MSPLRASPHAPLSLLLVFATTPVMADAGAAVGGVILILFLLMLCLGVCCCAGVGIFSCFKELVPRNFGEPDTAADTSPTDGTA